MNRLKKAVTGKSAKSSATDATVANNHSAHGDGFEDAPEVQLPAPLPRATCHRVPCRPRMPGCNLRLLHIQDQQLSVPRRACVLTPPLTGSNAGPGAVELAHRLQAT